jgi:hypothetical protein
VPERIMLRRKAGWRKPEGSVVVTRASRLWGNPFKIGEHLPEEHGGLLIADAEIASGLYRTALTNALNGVRYAGEYNPLWDRWKTPEDLRNDLYELRGRDLCCTCKHPAPGEPDHCHAVVLMEAAAALPERRIHYAAVPFAGPIPWRTA